MKMEKNSISRKIKRLVAILLAFILGYCLLTAASIISFSEKDETRPSDPLHMKRAMLYAHDHEMKAYSSPTPTSLYRSWKTKLPFLAREVFYYTGYKLVRLFR